MTIKNNLDTKNISFFASDYSKKVMIPYKATFGTRFVQAKVTGVDFVKRLVTLDSGDPISYTDLVTVLLLIIIYCNLFYKKLKFKNCMAVNLVM